MLVIHIKHVTDIAGGAVFVLIDHKGLKCNDVVFYHTFLLKLSLQNQ